MPIPDFQTIMLPLLKHLEDEKEHSLREVIEHISKLFNLSEEEKRELLPKGRQAVIDNRVGWARTYMKKAGLLEYTRRGHFRITDRGLEVLKEKPSRVDMKYLNRFPEFVEFRTRERKRERKLERRAPRTPEEIVEDGYQRIKSQLIEELTQLVKASPPDFFERLVVELLLKMGYGGSLREAGMAIGRVGDEGFDGIIKEDKLGLDNIYIQAKRWQGAVGRPELQKFVGALKGRKARKGIFITTSDFSKDAENYAKGVDDPKIVLIAGEQLAELMIDYNIGVTTVDTYEIKKIDRDYFPEE